VSAIEPVRDTQDRGEPLDAASQGAVERTVVAVLPLRRRAAVIARHVRDHDLLGGRHPEQIGVEDEMVRVLVMALVADVIAGVVQQRRVGEGDTIGLVEAESRGQSVEQDQAELLHVRRMRLLHMTALGEVGD